jgi:hypothetical protein
LAQSDWLARRPSQPINQFDEQHLCFSKRPQGFLSIVMHRDPIDRFVVLDSLTHLADPTLSRIERIGQSQLDVRAFLLKLSP